MEKKMKPNIMPIFLERTKFYKKYVKLSVPEILEIHGFDVIENEMDDEDIVYLERRKEFLMSRGIVDVPMYFKKEFVAEYPIKETKLIAEGCYLRKPSGEKMYGTYSYYFYKEGYRSYKGYIGKRVYADRVNKIVFLKMFEENFEDLIFE
nr:hypothetical protein [Enterococcus villorum]